MTDLTKLTIAEARDALKQREIKATELTDAYLKAIEASNPAINAYVAVTADHAQEMAKASQKRIDNNEMGALEGIPLGIKDLFATYDIHTQACSHILDGFKPKYESTVTANLWADGAVMLGKLNMDEFAMGSSNETSHYGEVINPWRAEGSDKQLVPGGSSGGSAAAVAAHLCAGATATDTGGSIRQPAALLAQLELNRPMVVVHVGGQLHLLHLLIKQVQLAAMYAIVQFFLNLWHHLMIRIQPLLMFLCLITKVS